jgi:hypothetical protein
MSVIAQQLSQWTDGPSTLLGCWVSCGARTADLVCVKKAGLLLLLLLLLLLNSSGVPSQQSPEK